MPKKPKAEIKKERVAESARAWKAYHREMDAARDAREAVAAAEEANHPHRRKYAADDQSIDARMARMLEDHQRMGTRP